MAETKQDFVLTVASSPHFHGAATTRTIMRDVLIALIPAGIGGIWNFGFRALLLILVSAAACVVLEWGYRKLRKLDSTVSDGSAVVTGVLLALACPVTIPIWCLLIGDAFAILVVKQLFGGIGKNFVNPALAARAFLFSWPVIMNTFVAPGFRNAVDLFGRTAELTTTATPLAALHQMQLPAQPIGDLFFGRIGGCIGETSVPLLLIGGVYLLARKVISPRIPLAYLGTVALLALLFPHGNDRLLWAAAQLCSGGLMLGAIYMATDYVTTPVTKLGQLLFGIGCGVITIVIRYFGSYCEGVTYAILVMNVCVVLLDSVGRPRRFGVKKGAKK